MPSLGRRRAARPEAYSAGFTYGLLSFGLLAGLGVLTGIVGARLFGVHVIGEWAIVYAPTSAVWSLSTVREQPALIRLLAPLGPRAPRATALSFAVFCFSSALTVVVSAIVAVIVYFVLRGPVGRPELFAPAMVHLGAYVLLKNTSWNLDSTFAAFRAARTLFWVRMHEAVIYLVFVIVAALFTRSIWGMVLSAVAMMATTLLHRVIAIRHWLTFRDVRPELRGGFRELPAIIRFGLRLTPGGIADGVTTDVATWTLASMGHVTALGAYNRAWGLANRFLLVNFRITEMLFPELVNRRRRGDHHGFDRALVETVRYAGVGLFLLAAVTGAIAPGVMGLYGEGFKRAAPALALVILVPAANTLSSVQSQGLLAYERPGTVTWVSLSRMAVTVAAVIPLTIAFGITGAAIGMVAGVAWDLALKTHLTRRLLQQPLHRLYAPRQVLALVVAYAGAFAAGRLVYEAVPAAIGPDLLGMAAGLVVAIVAYGILYFGVGGLSPADRDRAQRIRRRIAGPRQAVAS